MGVGVHLVNVWDMPFVNHPPFVMLLVFRIMVP